MLSFLKKSKSANNEIIKLKISGMHCNSCSLNIENELEDLPGVVEANVHYAKSEATINFDPEKVKPAKIKSVIEKLGYQV
ncbi:MAG: hypothetical protein A2383_04080 [Candidatus Pacebacteria bacterium RIFOXYB1_FULL_39_46]|nr:MAG: hypothetical protein A2383_04080 [Candidatus Pacebacteria bacterium RIFOXYB1_FULL_39_46]OGJ39135.1 MAG: hypothetical protein A2182_02325 [Candidatus Pacebacteria bacterium RIFOXYA1_FULL_38_18]OGJ40165.1 MAG: hypothetical protein A2582_03685 [Candidatus Pacebacteria bacterium RIFOXYD1_FULL_39_27]OGJ41049.1 MAG: hypothetical protein A2411_01030 [Candidatus Pacebacteria bacterium RIFOXYC1_FULL_39_21]